jgi:hypothetical protein
MEEDATGFECMIQGAAAGKQYIYLLALHFMLYHSRSTIGPASPDVMKTTCLRND